MTIKDIARESGYAVSTVSRALNNHPDVSDAAKAKIAGIVAAHGFVPNNNARQLKQQQSRNILIVVKGTFNMFFAAIVEQMQSLISSEGYSAQVHYLDEDANEVLVGEQLCRERKPLGLIFLGGNIDSFQKNFSSIRLPCVLATTIAPELHFPNLSCVGIDDAAAGRAVLDYLCGRGHRSIGVIGGSLELSYISARRYEGFLQGCEARGIAPDRSLFEKASFNYGSAYRAMGRLLERRGDITAVFCMSDVMAVGAMRAVKDAGRTVPGDISVVGFDGIELGRYCDPRLATVQQPRAEIAHTSVELLLSHIEKHQPVRQIVTGAELVEGESVRRL